MHRQLLLEAVSNPGEVWDIVVIGGGATGLGTAVEAAARGYRTVLVEAGDFARGTSSRSTKLIHGGVRYLRQGHVRMVRQSLVERGRLHHNAPHIVHPLNFVLPAYRTGSRWFYYAGLRAYDLLAGQLGLGRTQLLSRQSTLQYLPTLRPGGLQGGVLYTDGQFDDARLAIALAQTCVSHGGFPVNYLPVVQLQHQAGRVCGVVVRDGETQRDITLRCRVVINATGVFSDDITGLDRRSTSEAATDRQTEVQHTGRHTVVPSQGSHLVLDRSFLNSDHAMMIPQTDDGRVLFAIPWHSHLLLGTTDISVAQVTTEPRPLQSEVDYLLEHAGRYLTRQPTAADVLAMFAGLRPLVRGQGSGQSTASLSREHEILTSDSGLISVIGGKWTTYRQMGENVVDLAERVGGWPHRPSRTARLPLHGCPQAASRACQNSDHAPVTDSSDRHCSADPFAVYGTDAAAVQALIDARPELARPLHPRLSCVRAQVVWAARQEMARTVEDVLARRTRALFLDAQAASDAAPLVAALLREELQQTADWEVAQVRSFCELARTYRPA